jgi:uncharacterized protein (TIGR00290 family)
MTGWVESTPGDPDTRLRKLEWEVSGERIGGVLARGPQRRSHPQPGAVPRGVVSYSPGAATIGTVRAMSALSWSGGKDSALALRELRARSEPAPRALITTVTADYGRISMHGVRRELLSRQAQATGLPLVEVEIPAACSNEVYEQRMGQALAEPPLAEAQTIAFGDLFLADIRAYREERLSRTGKEAIFPLWGRDTSALAREFLAAGFEAVLVCVDPRRLDPSFAGRRFDAELLADLPPDVDPCGENGEFHTFVHAGPIFSTPIVCQVGETLERDGFVFCDVLATDASVRTQRGPRAPGRSAG